MMWMGVEARNLYAKLVTILGPEKDWFMKSAIVIAWGKLTSTLLLKRNLIKWT